MILIRMSGGGRPPLIWSLRIYYLVDEPSGFVLALAEKGIPHAHAAHTHQTPI
jgi:hypothetical protein